MTLTDQFKKGMYLQIDGDVCYVVDRKMQTQARQGGLIILRMRNLSTGNMATKTIKAGKKLDVIMPSTKKMQFLYIDDNMVYLMDMVSYETISVNAGVVGEYIEFLSEGEEILVLEYDGQIIDVKRNPVVTLEVIKSPDAVKGDTATNVTKEATMNTGLTVDVPLFIKAGDKITVNTESCKYTGRVNE